MIIWKVHGVNIVQVITETINNLFYNLFSSIDNSLYSTLDDLLFINLDSVKDTYLKTFLGNNSNSGIILICKGASHRGNAPLVSSIINAVNLSKVPKIAL